MLKPALRAALLLALAFVGVVLGLGDAVAGGKDFEVWAIDQSGTAGTLYIFEGEELEEEADEATPEVVDLGAQVGPACLTQTGTSPTRAHMLTFNDSNSHAILSYVASGHVVFIDAETRAPLTCIDVGAQAHAAFPAPDESYVVVANQNGKLLQRINTNYETDTFTLDGAATINLATCTTPNGAACESATLRPDNAPICPVIDSSSRLVFVTLRGGGMFVVDATTTPMGIIAEYDKDNVHPNGCGGIETRGKVFVNSGGGTTANPTESDLYSFPLEEFPDGGFNSPNTPAPTVVFSKDAGDHDSHGTLLTKGRGLVWVGDRFANEIEVVDPRRDELVNTFSLAGDVSADPAPDLMDVSPDGKHAFVALRGPCPLTANAAGVNNAVGATPGVGVLEINRGGFEGELVGVAPIANPAPAGFDCPTRTDDAAGSITNQADPHALRVRLAED